MRIKSISITLVILFSFSALSSAYADQVVYLIRHAEQMRDVEDPPLTDAGEQRAKTWAGILRDADLKVIYTSKKRRTMQTGEPIAKALNVPLEIMSRKDVQGLVDRVRTQHVDEALERVQAGIAILRESETAIRFLGPYAMGALALVTDDADERREALKAGESLLRGHLVSHNYFRFYRDAMETCLRTAEWVEAERYAVALENYTRDEPLPWSDFDIVRTRALSALGQGRGDDSAIQEIRRLHSEAERARLTIALPALEKALSEI